MRDQSNRTARPETPTVMVFSRMAFLLYFLFLLSLILRGQLPYYALLWVGYLLGIYIVAEKIYDVFRKRDINLSFAFPLIVAVYLLHLISLLVRGQEEFPLLNRAEHFASFVLITYIVWIFFLKYLPQDVWQKHPYYTAFLVLAITSLAGVGNELFELLFDGIFKTDLVGGQYDTSMDLLMNTLGSGSFLIVQLIMSEGEKT